MNGKDISKKDFILIITVVTIFIFLISTITYNFLVTRKMNKDKIETDITTYLENKYLEPFKELDLIKEEQNTTKSIFNKTIPKNGSYSYLYAYKAKKDNLTFEVLVIQNNQKLDIYDSYKLSKELNNYKKEMKSLINEELKVYVELEDNSTYELNSKYLYNININFKLDMSSESLTKEIINKLYNINKFSNLQINNIYNNKLYLYNINLVLNDNKFINLNINNTKLYLEEGTPSVINNTNKKLLE